MRITMIAIGSTGDVRPYILLGHELSRRGHHIRIASFEPFQSLVLEAGLSFTPISGDVSKLMAEILKPGVTGVNYLQKLERNIKSVADALLNDLTVACKDAEAIISTFFGSTAYSIAEKNHVPCIQTQYYPMDCNTTVPISSAPGLRLGKIWNKASYKVGYLMISTLERRYLTRWRRREGMQVRKIRPMPDYVVHGHTIPVLYAVSPLLLQRPKAWNEHIHMTGFWTSKPNMTYTPPPDLVSFLAKKEPPIYIGFGSMVSSDMGETLQIVLEAVRLAHVRAILLKGWGGNDAWHSTPDVYVGDYIPHDWLFKQVAAVVHHGGAGTTAAGLQAGKPTLIIPFGGDQPFWGMRIHAIGCGPKPISRANLTVAKLAKALTDLKDNLSYGVAAREIGIRLTMEDGIDNAVTIIEEEINNWLSVPDT